MLYYLKEWVFFIYLVDYKIVFSFFSESFFWLIKVALLANQAWHGRVIKLVGLISKQSVGDKFVVNFFHQAIMFKKLQKPEECEWSREVCF